MKKYVKFFSKSILLQGLMFVIAGICYIQFINPTLFTTKIIENEIIAQIQSKGKKGIVANFIQDSIQYEFYCEKLSQNCNVSVQKRSNNMGELKLKDLHFIVKEHECSKIWFDAQIKRQYLYQCPIKVAKAIDITNPNQPIFYQVEPEKLTTYLHENNRQRYIMLLILSGFYLWAIWLIKTQVQKYKK